VSELLAALPPLAALLLLAFVIASRRWLGRREARRRAAAARHPSRRHPGRPVDGEPLSEAELREYTGIMFRSSGNQGKQGAS
jgi:hypothetical protein